MLKEDFPISHEVGSRFILENRRQWERDERCEKDPERIVLNFSMVRMQAAWIIPKLLYAKGISDRAHKKVTVITWRENALLTELFDSFGFEHYCIEEENRRNLSAGRKAVYKTAQFMVCDGTGEGLKRFKMYDIPVGKAIYEDVLRTSELSTLRSAKNSVCLKKMIHLLWMLYALDRYCKKHRPLIAVADDCAYHEAAQSALFHKYGASVSSSNSTEEILFHFRRDHICARRDEMMNHVFHRMICQMGKEEVLWSENYLKDRFAGKNGREIDRGAYAGKRVLSRQDAIEEFQLDPEKKNVVIMAHTFTDAVFNYGNTPFRDYYDWLEQTLQSAKENKKVNWILKPHPTRSAYHESMDSIEDMFERYRAPHMTILSDDVSAESIKNFADVLVTIGSNAGGEFACFGIPTVIVGRPYYKGFGYTTEPANKEEYQKVLREIEKIPELSEEQAATAKKVFYLRNTLGFGALGRTYTDEFANLVNGHYRKMQEEMPIQYFESNDGTKKYNNETLKAITEYFEKHDMHKCQYYQAGYERGKVLTNV